MFKLDLEKAEQPEIKLPTSIGSSKKQESSRKTSISASWTMLKPLCGSQQTVENSSWDGNTRSPDLPPEKLVWRSRSNGQNWTCNWFQIGKGVRQGCVLSPSLFNLYTDYIMRNARLDKAQAGIKIARRNINNLRYADDTTLMSESQEELKSLFVNVKEWKSWLKTHLS